jgi:hypothetical protein
MLCDGLTEKSRGLTMIGILILSFSLLLAGALPWWPYSAAGRSRHIAHGIGYWTHRQATIPAL